ncbi:MAG: hypothetical protein HY774_08240 [Acidobacteria bacterium]|nr:hypothetical protein [Acidobacteriota bacterium]
MRFPTFCCLCGVFLLMMFGLDSLSFGHHSIQKKKPDPFKPLHDTTCCVAIEPGTSLCAINTNEGAYWFLTGGSYLNSKAITASEVHPSSSVDALDISPDGKYLAVTHHGEGHLWLYVLDLQALLADESKYVVVQEINPYPGGVYVTSLDQSFLYFESDWAMHRRVQGEHALIAPSELALLKLKKFRMDLKTGQVTPLDPKLNDLGSYYGAALVNPKTGASDRRYTVLPALAFLKEKSSLPFLNQALKQKSNEPLRAEIEALIEALSR